MHMRVAARPSHGRASCSWLLLIAALARPVAAPPGAAGTAQRVLGGASPPGSRARSTPDSSQATRMAAGACAAAGAAAWLLLSKPKASPGTPSYLAAGQRFRSVPKARCSSIPTQPFIPDARSDSDPDCAYESSCEDHSAAEGSDDSEPESTPSPSAPRRKSTGKLWSTAQFPEGTTGARNWELANLHAAQSWDCPCPDRKNCLDRMTILELYEYRKQFQTVTAPQGGGQRDACRRELEGHYNASTRSFTRSFVVGKFGDCCAAAAGLAKGMSFANWSSSRTDVRKQRVWHEGRATARQQQEGQERAAIEAYIRELRTSLEGPKGGSDPNDKWTIGYLPMSERYSQYRRKCNESKVPVLGGLKLFEKIWAEHNEIVNVKATGHAKCDECGLIAVERGKVKGRMDEFGRARNKEIDEWELRHDAEHLQERNYAEDWWHKGKHHPQHVTAFSMDAPTERQFDIPVQQRSAKDPVKSLDTAKKWASKITGLMVAGLGMLAFVSRAGLGSGPNLSLTVMYLGLLHVVASGRTLGTSFNILLDNTCGDNKHNEMIFFLAWLVLNDTFTEASFFCMQTGHTYSRIDQTFRTLIQRLLQQQIWMVSQLVTFIAQFLRPYDCFDCIELHCLWDWKAYFAPHVHERFAGFATSQFGSGMHEFVLRKDANGDVRLWLRASSQASSWEPSGPGYLVFKSSPTGPPALARTKPDEAWNRSTVESTVRQWFRYMPVSPQELAKVKADWDARFATLPVDCDTNQLPADMKLQWLDLPTCQSATLVPVSGMTLGTSGALENPAVNPVTGPGRTSADVQRELRTHQAMQRRSDGTAIFQADFLFIRLASGELQLHRVAHGLCVYAATAPFISFTTVEYVHHAQPGLSGFWGYFTLKENDKYDARNRKTGTKFVRHENLTRENVVLYNASVFESPAPHGHPTTKVIRVSSESLRALAAKAVEQPAVPDKLPETHAPASAGLPRHSRRQAASQRQAEQEEDEDEDDDEDDDEDEDEEEDEEQESEQESEGVGVRDGSGRGASSADRVGLQMEAQSCDPDECEMYCGLCEWEECVITADHGNACDVLFPDGKECCNLLNRFLRKPGEPANKRRRAALHASV